MSKKSKRRPTNQPGNRPNPASSKPAIVTTNSKKAAPRQPNKRWILLAVSAIVILVGLGITAFLLLSPLPSSNAQATKTSQPRRIGTVSCKEIPKFVQDLKFSASAAFSTSDRTVKGLTLVEAAPAGQQGTVYQHPSWSSAGYLSQIEFGKKGTLYLAPAPSISVLYNPPAEQNRVYRVDNQTGIMSLFISLSQANPSGEENPFGVMGLDYDCETNKLYVSSVAGSTRRNETGRLYLVDPDKATVEAQLDNIDAMGMSVFTGIKGKRLYYGLARLPEIWSVALDDKGNFQGQPRLEISLANLGARGSDKARRIDFIQDSQMQVYGIEFSFNLIAPTEKQETVYRFRYDQVNDTWTLIPNDTN